MAKTAKASVSPDAILSWGDDQLWHITCLHCTRTLTKGHSKRPEGYWQGVEHLRYSHALLSVYIDYETPGYRAIVNEALPLVVAHDMQTIDHVRAR